MTATLIDTTVMPADDMSPGLIEAAAADFRSVGSKVSSRGGTVVTDWEQISAVYEAPESATLTQAMDPAKTKAEAFGTDMTAAAKALDTFADAVRTIKAEVAKIRADAATFLGGITDGKISKLYYGGGDYYTGDFDWHTDQATVDANNALIGRAHAQQEALEAAERACASAIRAAVGLGPVGPRTAANPNGYGSTDIPDNQPMPWGAAGERTEGCLELAGNGVTIDGAGGVLADIGSLVGISYTSDEGFDWSLSTAGEAAKGSLMFGVGALTLSVPGLIAGQAIPGPVGKFLRDSQLTVPAAVASLAAIDLYNQDPLHKWREDAARAGGETLFNIVTLPLAALKVTKLGRLGKGSPDVPEATPSTRPFGDPADSVRGVDPDVLDGLGRQADLDGPLSIRTDVDIDLSDGSRADGSGPSSDRTNNQPAPGDGAGLPSDRADDGDRPPSDGDDSQPGSEPPAADPGDVRRPDNGSADGDQPEIGSGTGTEADPRVYSYENRAEALRGTPEPDLADAPDLGRSRDHTPGTPEHMESRWQEYLSDKSRKGEAPKSWEKWRDQYITNQGNDPKGKAFEQAYRADHPQYDAGGYQFNTLVPDTTKVRRNYDILSLDPPEAIELKSGRNVDGDQLAKDARLVRDGWSVRYVFGQEPTPGTLRRLERLGIDVEIFHSVPVVVQ